MIKVSNKTIEPGTIVEQYGLDGIERKIVDILSASADVYAYETMKQLRFELTLRKSIINAAVELYRSSFSFRIFRKSICNPDYWHRTEEGGFLLEAGAKPSEAITDIYIQSSKYGTECATAIVIIYYKSLVDVFPEELFNRLFPEIYLMNWQHLDSDLGITGYDNIKDLIPGDCRYFKNPDVNPLTPEWQGENTIYLSNGSFYGHGIGIGDADGIINALNRHRINESNTSAYLTDFAQHPDFKHLARYI